MEKTFSGRSTTCHTPFWSWAAHYEMVDGRERLRRFEFRFNNPLGFSGLLDVIRGRVKVERLK